MKTIILSVIAAYCAFRWFLQSINTMTMIWYIQKKNIPLPDERDIREGTKWVIERILDDIFPWRNKR